MDAGESHWDRDYKRLGEIAKLATTYMIDTLCEVRNIVIKKTGLALDDHALRDQFPHLKDNV